MRYNVKFITAVGKLLEKEFVNVSATSIQKEIFDDGCLLVSMCKINIHKKRQTQLTCSDILFFNQELLTMLKSGITLLQALDMLSKYNRNIRLRRSLVQIVVYVKGGMSFSEAIEEVGTFPKDYFASIIIGERSGRLIDTIKNWIYLQTFIQKNKRCIIEAFIYPLFLIGTLFISLVIITHVVLPKLASFYTDILTLPVLTQYLIIFSNFMQKTIYLQLLGLMTLYFTLKWFLNKDKGKIILDLIILSIPKLGTLYNMYHSALFTRSLSILLLGGTSLPKSLVILQSIIMNITMKKKIIKAIELVNSGSSLHIALQNVKLLHPLGIEMIKVGEQSSSLSEMLIYVSDFFDQEILKIANLTKVLIGPLIIVIMGIIVMGFIFAVYVPLFDIGNNIYQC